ncbi:hypothetical protein Droror1_Dr00020735 [Drosera rotundifolia]
MDWGEEEQQIRVFLGGASYECASSALHMYAPGPRRAPEARLSTHHHSHRLAEAEDEAVEDEVMERTRGNDGVGTSGTYQEAPVGPSELRAPELRLDDVGQHPRAKVAEEDDDDEYMPCDEDQSGPSESDYDVTKAATNSRSRSQSLSRSRSRSRMMKRKISTPRKKASEHTIDCSESVDEEKALMQAIALSHKDSHAVPLVPYAGTSRKLNLNVNEINDHTEKRKKRTKVPNRVQMTKNDVVIHFCQFDVVGKGSITKRDLQRMAACHDFI